MRYLHQLAVLMIFWAFGEAVSEALSTIFPIPGTIVGMLLLFTALSLGLVNERQVNETADFLLSNIAFFFIPACISILEVKPELWRYFPVLIGIAVVTTLLTMAASGSCVQWVLKRRGSHG